MNSHCGMTTSLSLKDIFLCCSLLFLTACKTMPTTPDTAADTATKDKPADNVELTSPKTSTSATDEIDPVTDTSTGNLTSEEKTQKLDQQLDERFADFDRLLLREREFLNEKQNEQGAPQSGGSDGTTGGGIDGFEGLDEYGDIAESGSEPYNNSTVTQQTAGENAFPSENTNINIPPDLVNSKGDDVIARQLREAALKEKDPVLREKLWDEYRKYKKGI